jgi:hypothetical protein
MYSGDVIPTGSDLIYEYTLPSGKSIDYLIYKAFDGTDNSASGVITFMKSSRWMESDDFRDHAPNALDDNISMQEDGIKIVEFIGFDPNNVFHVNADIEITEGPFNGTLDPSPPISNVDECAEYDNETDCLGAECLWDGSECDPDINTSMAKWLANYIPEQDYEGSDSIKFTVTNPSNTEHPVSDIGTILITIYPVNDLPCIYGDNNVNDCSDIPNVSMDEDTDLTFTVDYSDVDNILDATVSSSILTLGISLQSLTLLSPYIQGRSFTG